jgi:hypothetical protein
LQRIFALIFSYYFTSILEGKHPKHLHKRYETSKELASYPSTQISEENQEQSKLFISASFLRATKAEGPSLFFVWLLAAIFFFV